MANPNDTSKPARSRRDRPKGSAAPPSATIPVANTAPTPPLTLEDAIENERTLLLQVRAMLHCLYEVLLYADDDDSIMHAEIAHTAARLIDDSCVRLDSVNLHPLFEAIRQGGSGAPREDDPDLACDRPYQVREPMPVYLA